jgi:diguanylate cyclase (GGDEF)-like protein/PAS domain S-box-containing protein
MSTGDQVSAKRPAVPARGSRELAESRDLAAVFDALPEHIAVLDGRGVIIQVNEAWRNFGDANGLHSPGHATGTDYLAVCDSAVGADAPMARRVAAGIRSVMEGKREDFSEVYPCHAPMRQRWFRVTAVPTASPRPGGCVVMHLDVTVEKQAETSLHIDESRFREMAESIEEVLFLRDAATGAILYVNQAYEKIWGYSRASLYANPDSWADAVHPDDRNLAQVGFLRGTATASVFEYRIIRPDGAIRWITSRRYPVVDRNGRVVRVTGVAADVTERKRAEARISHLQRVYAVLGGINSLIVHVQDLDELFRESCRIAVDDGGFRMSMIIVRDWKSGEVVPAASSGKDDRLMHEVREMLASDRAPNTIVMTAMAQKKTIVSNDSQRDPRLLLGPLYIEAGVRSLVALPLVVADVAFGVLLLYANEVDFFGEEELALLSQLADDVAFAVDHIGKSEQLAYLSSYDLLTGLANQALFLQRLGGSLLTHEHGTGKIAVFVLDVERFKSINDAFGRQAGDELLRKVAEGMVAHGGNEPTRFARVGPDRFAIVASGFESAEQVARYVEQRLNATFQAPFRVEDRELRVFVKVGIALFPDDGADADTLFHNAEAALKKAKAGGDRYLFFTPKMTERVAERISLENSLRHALDKGEYVLHYQPKLSLATGMLTGAEALIRWNDPKSGLVPPLQFIPVLEETGLIHEVGRWAMRRAIDDYLRWRSLGFAPLRIAVNVSPLQLRNRAFAEEVAQALGGDPGTRDALELEITESLIMEDVKHSISVLKAIRGMGVTIAIDDFGTGFSSLSYLSKLPIDTLKIDRSFISGMDSSSDEASLVSSIIQLSHSMKLKVVAEGVESEEQERLLRGLGCDEIQGYLVSRPLEADAFEARFLAAHLIPPICGRRNPL